MRRTRTAAAFITALTTGLALVGGVVVSASAPLTAEAAPRVRVTRVVGGLTIPWDVTWVGGAMLFDQRAGGMWSKRGSAAPRRITMALPRIFHQSESGMLGIVADPGAAGNKLFYTCMAVANANGSSKDIEVWKWRLTSDVRAVAVRRLIIGIPLTTGQHGGCRLRFRSAQMLYVGTGDGMQGTNPQRLSSLGGKILRVRSDGVIPTTNPFYRRGGNARYVYNYGHRNVQGLVTRPGTTQMWSVEHGPDRDDEVNRVFRGANYGWSPTPGYNSSRPMTDKGRFPNAVSAKWRSGSPTVATSGATFISGRQWGSWNGILAVGLLKGRGIRLFTINKASNISHMQTLFRSYGRIRTVQEGPDGAIYFTTSNGANDGIYRITAG